MARTKGFDTIQTLAESAEAIRSRAVSEQRSALQEEQRRLAQLEQYRTEYQALSIAPGQGLSIHSVCGRRGFVQKLNEAIDNQRCVVERARQQLDAQLMHWRQARSKSMSLQKYADRLMADDQRRAARQEQTELDDIGRRQSSRRS